MALNFGRREEYREEPEKEKSESNILKAANQSFEENTSSPFDKNEEDIFNSLLGNDNETNTPNLYLNGGTKHTTEYENTEHLIARSIKETRKENPMGGIKASRFITTEILLNAPKDYFDQFNQIVEEGVKYVQNQLSDKQHSGVTGAAQNDPTNEEKQDKAYRIVNGFANDFLEKSTYRSTQRTIINSLICSEIVGFGKLDPLWHDKEVDEIICNGPYDIQIEIKGKVRKVESCKFRNEDHIMSLISRLYAAIGKTVSRSTPIVGGRLHDNSRMETVHTSVAPDGPNFNIRRHKEEYIPPAKLLEWGTSNVEILEFLGNLIYKGCSLLIIGGTSSGKTTLLGALSGFIRPDHRIVTLEDNLELKLNHKKLHAAPMECTPDKADGGKGTTMQDLVKSSLRLRPNAIIVGEVRDGAAYDLSQALNTGHYGMSTVHANNEFAAIYRLVSLVSQGGLIQGDAVLPLIAASFDAIVRIDRFPTDGSRKIVSISEVAPFPERNSSGELVLPTTPLWKYVEDGLDENYKVLGHWEKVNEISQMRRELRRLDLEDNLTWDELKEISE